MNDLALKVVGWILEPVWYIELAVETVYGWITGPRDTVEDDF